MTDPSVEETRSNLSAIVEVHQTRSTSIMYSRLRRICNLSIKNITQIISNFLFPLILAIFTITITLHQRAENAIQRQQDLNISALQRENDLFIAGENRKGDDLNAEIQRNMSRVQREHELYVEEERYRDQLLVAYINELAHLLKENNGSVTRDPLTHMVVRSKTLILIRQLDPKRNTIVARFLLDTGQLTSNEFEKELDLSDSDLHGINLSGSSANDDIIWSISIGSTYMNNALIENRQFERSNFRGTFLNNVSFIGTSFSRTNFVNVYLDKSRFLNSHIAYVNIEYSSLIDTNFFHSIISSSSFGVRNSFVRSNFSSCFFSGIEVESNNMDQSDFSNSALDTVSFFMTSIEYADFEDSTLYNVSFEMANLAFTNFALIRCILCSFLASNLSFANFTNAEGLTDEDFQLAASIHGMIFPNGSTAVDPSKLYNGKPECDIPFEDHWNLERGSVRIASMNNNTNNDCIFIGTDDAVMSQYLSFGETFLGFSTAMLEGRLGIGVTLLFTQFDRNSNQIINQISKGK